MCHASARYRFRIVSGVILQISVKCGGKVTKNILKVRIFTLKNVAFISKIYHFGLISAYFHSQ